MDVVLTAVRFVHCQCLAADTTVRYGCSCVCCLSVVAACFGPYALSDTKERLKALKFKVSITNNLFVFGGSEVLCSAVFGTSAWLDVGSSCS
jgi:hypothetical protein